MKNFFLVLLFLSSTTAFAEGTTKESKKVEALSREPSSVSPTTAIQPPSAPSLKFNGYVDLRLSSLTVKDNPTWDGHAESGYTLEEGRLAFNYAEGLTEIIADIPFRRCKDCVGAGGSSDTRNSSSLSNVVFGNEKLQFYGKYKLGEATNVWLGQFDTPYGIEANDSKDRAFSKAGVIFDEVLPTTHTGLLFETTQNSIYGKIFSANSNNKGSLGNDATGDNNFEYGTAVGFSNDKYRGQLGYMSRLINKADGTGLAARNFVDLTLGSTFDWISVDLEFTQLTDPSKNTLTPTDTSDSEKAGTGMLALVTLSPWEKWSFSLRAETLQNATSATSDSDKKTVSSTGVDVKFKLAPNVETRIEYISQNFQRVDDSKWSLQRGLLSAILSY